MSIRANATFAAANVAVSTTVGVPTIVTTGHGDYATVAGSFPVIRKPFDPDILHRWLSHKLRRALI